MGRVLLEKYLGLCHMILGMGSRAELLSVKGSFGLRTSKFYHPTGMRLQYLTIHRPHKPRFTPRYCMSAGFPEARNPYLPSVTFTVEFTRH